VNILARVPVPPSWSVAPKQAMKSMRQAAFQRAPRGPLPYKLQLASFPSSHLFRQHRAEYYLTLSLLTGGSLWGPLSLWWQARPESAQTPFVAGS